jgi:crotonobetainyl-CoA:carnitine CoA-transferase CaiB-like acyl-CoA transferase
MAKTMQTESGDRTMEEGEPEGKALGGIRVLDLTDEKGVYCAKLLADMGADVVRIEPPDGDPMRRMGPFVENEPGPERSIPFLHYNTSKRGITLDYTTPEGKELFLSLTQRSDIIVETHQPGVMDDLGLGYDVLSESNPGLIMTSITGFGQNGPHRNYKCSDITAYAMGGYMFVTGFPEDPPVRGYGNQSYHVGSIYGTIGSLSALFNRNFTGLGQHVDVSLQEAVLSITEHVNLYYVYENHVSRRQGTAHGTWQLDLKGPLGIGDVFECKDGHACVFGLKEDTIQWLIDDGIKEAEPYLDPKWAEPDLIEQRGQAMNVLVRDWVKRYTMDEILTEGQRRRITTSPVNTPDKVFHDPHLRERGFFVDVEHPELGRSLTYPGAPYKFPESPWRINHKAPLLGEHNGDIYVGELGLEESRLEELKRKGVI